MRKISLRSCVSMLLVLCMLFGMATTAMAAKPTKACEAVTVAKDYCSKAQQIVDIVVEHALSGKYATIFKSAELREMFREEAVDVIIGVLDDYEDLMVSIGFAPSDKEIVANELFDVACLYADEEAKNGQATANKKSIIRLIAFVLQNVEDYPSSEAQKIAEVYYEANGKSETAAIEYLASELKVDSHKFDTKDKVTEATCTEKGYTTYTCSCGASEKRDETPALEHSWKDATCTAPKTCSACGATEGSVKDHSWDNGAVTKEPTETETGVKTFTCSSCGATKTEAIPVIHICKFSDATCTTPKTCTSCGATEGTALGHAMIEKVDAKYLKSAADCKNAAVYYKSCERCGDKSTETFTSGNPADHTWKDATCTAPKTCTTCGATEGKQKGHSYTETVTAPTCTEAGYTTHTCANCGDSYKDNEVAALDHSWDEGIITREPTENRTGNRRYTCTVCKTTKNETLPKLEHTHSYTETVVAPTCTEAGYTNHVCSCGDSYKDNEVAALGHAMIEKVDAKYLKSAADCKNAAVYYKSCERCGDKSTETFTSGNPADHTWKDATCTAPKTCTTCGATEGKQKGHSYTETVTAPTCTEAGYTTHTCANCGDSYKDNEVAALDHSWDEGVVTREPTENRTGIKEYTCTVCKTTKTETLSKLEHTHSYTETVTVPTCTEKGYTTYTCSCGDTYTSDEVAALGHNEVVDKGYAATCTKDGLTDGKHCDRCNVVLTKQEVIPATGHDFSTGTCPGCNAEAVVITAEPKTGYAKMGEVAKVSLEAEGEDLQYQWYIRNADQTKYSKSSVTGSTYSCRMSEKSKDRRALCIITDKYGNKVQSKTVVIREAVSVVTEPKTTYAKAGETVKIAIEASGDELTYQWYIKNAGASKYSKSSVTSATYSVKMSEKVHGRRILCVIKDKYGNKVETKTVVLRMAATITEQPVDVTVAKGETAKVTVVAVGEELTYQWYIKNTGKEKFVKSSITDATYSVDMTNKVDGRQIYCEITDKYGKTVTSEIVILKMK